jgi:hypothetical protein
MRLWTVIATELWARLFLDQRAACSITGSIDQIPAPVEPLGVRAQMHP